MQRTTTSAILGLLLITACGDGGTPASPSSSPLSAVARAYVNEALGVMQLNSVRRFQIDWVAFRQATVDSATNAAAQTTADAYGAIRFAVGMLGDNHSSFRPPAQTGSAPVTAVGASGRTAASSTAVPFGEPASYRLEGDIGYIHVPLHSSRTVAEGTVFADRVQDLIEAVDAPNTCGWIVDIRGNLGGNMWPMVAGVGPVLGQGTLGFFVDPDPQVPNQTWTYENGEAANDGIVNGRVTTPYELRRPNPTVAVLWEEHTASSGEAVATAFIGRPRTRSFGEPSLGLSTGNRLFQLSDGSAINLTTVTFADRMGQAYGGRISPDVIVEHVLTDQSAPDPTAGDDPVVLAALEWLAAAGDCTAT